MNIAESVQAVLEVIQQLEIKGTENNINIMLWCIRTLKEIGANAQKPPEKKQESHKEYEVKTYGGEEK